jgi:ferredoxin
VGSIAGMASHVVTAVGLGSFEVEEGTRLTIALEKNGVDVSHRCGGLARCTTCRVKFLSEEPPMGDAEKDSLEEDGVLGQFRLSCQIRVDRPMEVEVLMRASEKGWEPGPALDD